MNRLLACASGLLLLAACDNAQETTAPVEETPAPNGAITTQALSAHIQILASDAFEGRAPATPGEDKTVAYLAEKFAQAGLQPGVGDSYFQEVPLVEITAAPSAELSVAGEDATERFSYWDDVIVWTKRVVGRAEVLDSDMVFVGYGIVAPEYGWNDYDGIDVTGKTVVMLVNDPGFATGDSALFNGRAMTYYGRWTYKFEEAARQGAAAAIVVHEDAPAAYPWGVVTSSWSGPQLDLQRPDDNASRAAIEGWISAPAAERLLAMAGLDLAGVHAAAIEPDFKPIPLGLTASVAVDHTVRRSSSKNVIAVLPGAERPDETVLYMAHWDHLGRDPKQDGDQIYNGALDNATGLGGLLELAEAFATLDRPPARSVVFAAWTAEESGLLGSAHYAENPPFPLDRTVAGINMDGLNIYGRMHDITVIGYGASELEVELAAAAATQRRVVRPEPTPERGYFYRSDHFNLAKKGVPVLYTANGIDHVEHGPDWTLRQQEAWIAAHYHKPSDEYDPAWDLTGAVDDLELLFAVGHGLAASDHWPNWNDGNEFRAARDAARPDG